MKVDELKESEMGGSKEEMRERRSVRIVLYSFGGLDCNL